MTSTNTAAAETVEVSGRIVFCPTCRHPVILTTGTDGRTRLDGVLRLVVNHPDVIFTPHAPACPTLGNH